MKWDHEIPKTPADVIKLLERRIEVHSHWRDFLRAGDERTLASVEYGTGTIETHSTYIRQYEAAIRIIKGQNMRWKRETANFYTNDDGWSIEKRVGQWMVFSPHEAEAVFVGFVSAEHAMEVVERLLSIDGDAPDL